MTLSVVVPVFNEAQNLPALYARVVDVLERAGVSFELLLVNDGSTDESLRLIHGFRSIDSRVSVLNLSRNFGHQIAITAGMEHARGRAVVVMDADLQDPPAVLLRMLEKWREGNDVVYGVRTRRKGEGVFKRATAAAYYRLLRAFSSVDVPVDAGDFRLLSRRALDAVRRMPERHRYVRGLVSWVGFRTAEVRYERDPRHAGRSKYSLTKMVRFAVDGLVSFSTAPLKLLTWLGGFTLAGSVLGGVLLAYRHLALDLAAPGWMVVLAGVGMVGGVQLVGVGILGEYLGRTYDEVKGRPLYVVEHLLQGDAAAVACDAELREAP